PSPTAPRPSGPWRSGRTTATPTRGPPWAHPTSRSIRSHPSSPRCPRRPRGHSGCPSGPESSPESRRTPMTADIAKTVASLRDTFDSGQTRSAGWRKAQLGRLRQLLTEGEDEIAKAMRDDLGKAPAEGWVTEVRLVQRELTHMIGHLDAWMRPDHVHV